MIRFFILFLVSSLLILPSAGMIEDEFVESTLSKDLKIRKYQPPKIEDDFVENRNYTSVKKQNVRIIEILPNADSKIVQRPYHMISENDIPVRICIREKFSTKQKREEGQIIEFETLDEVKFKNKLYPAGTVVKARIENISMNSTWGAPADFIIGNFSLDEKPLFGEVTKIGANRAIWLHPLAVVATSLFGTGIWLMFIRGGHAKIKPKEVFTVYF